MLKIIFKSFSFFRIWTFWLLDSLIYNQWKKYQALWFRDHQQYHRKQRYFKIMEHCCVSQYMLGSHISCCAVSYRLSIELTGSIRSLSLSTESSRQQLSSSAPVLSRSCSHVTHRHAKSERERTPYLWKLESPVRTGPRPRPREQSCCISRSYPGAVSD